MLKSLNYVYCNRKHYWKSEKFVVKLYKVTVQLFVQSERTKLFVLYTTRLLKSLNYIYCDRKRYLRLQKFGFSLYKVTVQLFVQAEVTKPSFLLTTITKLATIRRNAVANNGNCKDLKVCTKWLYSFLYNQKYCTVLWSSNSQKVEAIQLQVTFIKMGALTKFVQKLWLYTFLYNQRWFEPRTFQAWNAFCRSCNFQQFLLWLKTHQTNAQFFFYINNSCTPEYPARLLLP